MAPSDRREQRRVAIAGTARVVGQPGVEFVIRDLSVDGARLVGRTYLVEGRRVQLALKLDDEQLVVAADVIRTDPQRAEVAIAFRNLTRELQQRIEHSIDGMLSRVRAASPATVVVLGVPDAEVDALERDIARLGRSMQRCASPAGVLTALQDPELRCAALLVANGRAGHDLAGLFDRVRQQHPQIKRVLLFGDQLEPVAKDVSRRVDAVLRTPVRIRALARAIGADSPDNTQALMLPTVDES